ncbi:NTP transferase domain-containing protein [Candidatus Fermentibacterales bacterium]|nr:NTP transferase domain-containing protein [Candidatus Fermentibacterales bacterium]
MQAIVPVAGAGTRLRPHTYTAPKALLEVAGKPILGHILDLLVPVGVDRLILVTGHLGEMVRDYVEASYCFDLSVAEQPVADGLGDAISRAAPFVDEGPVLVVLGDTLFSADLDPVVASDVNMIAVRKVEDPRRFGVVLMSGNRVSGLVEKPEEPVSNLAIVGVYYFASARRLMRATSSLIESGRRTRGEFQLTDAMQIMLQEGEAFSVFRVDDWLDCGKPETLLSSNRALLEKAGHELPDTCRRDQNCFIPPVFVASSARLENCVIGPWASVGADCRISGSVVRDSLVWSGAEIEGCALEHSIIGSNTTVRGYSGSLNIGDSSLVEARTG